MEPIKYLVLMACFVAEAEYSQIVSTLKNLSCALHLDFKAEPGFWRFLSEKKSPSEPLDRYHITGKNQPRDTDTMPIGNLLLDVIFPKGHGPLMTRQNSGADETTGGARVTLRVGMRSNNIRSREPVISLILACTFSIQQ
jgi:hypothetical protein